MTKDGVMFLPTRVAGQAIRDSGKIRTGATEEMFCEDCESLPLTSAISRLVTAVGIGITILFRVDSDLLKSVL